jgi:hypothetical protein
MSTIAEIDARIAQLHSEESEIICLKAARNALTPFGTLPDELLLNVVKYLPSGHNSVRSDAPKQAIVYRLSAVCAHMRAALVRAPELWTEIEWRNGSDPHVISLMLARTQASGSA